MNKQIIYDRANFVLNSYLELGIIEEDLNNFLNKTDSNFNKVVNRIYLPLSIDNLYTKEDVKIVLNDILRDKIAKNKDIK